MYIYYLIIYIYIYIKSLNLSNHIQVLHRDAEDFVTDAQFDVIVSNPPYLRTDEMRSISAELQYEDQDALCGNNTNKK